MAPVGCDSKHRFQRRQRKNPKEIALLAWEALHNIPFQFGCIVYWYKVFSSEAKAFFEALDPSTTDLLSWVNWSKCITTSILSTLVPRPPTKNGCVESSAVSVESGMVTVIGVVSAPLRQRYTTSLFSCENWMNDIFHWKRYHFWSVMTVLVFTPTVLYAKCLTAYPLGSLTSVNIMTIDPSVYITQWPILLTSIP